MARVGNRIWSVWLGDATAAKWEATGNFLILAYSDDDGVNWSREYYLVPQNPVTDRTCDPRLWLAPDGKLWVLYCQSGGGMVLDGQLGVWANIITDPLAATPSFEPGFHLTDGLPARPFKFRNQWYLPVDYINGNPKRFPERAGKHIYSFDWANKRVTKVSTVPKTPNADFNEHNYVELKNGRLYTQSRSYDGIYQSTSTGIGSLTFNALSRWLFYPSIPSRHSLARTPSGRLMMIYNQTNNGAGRTDMAIALSDDDGATWPFHTVFDSRPQVSYPDIDFAANGDIMVISDRGRNGYKEIWYTRINEESIVKGAPQVTVRLVNKQ